MSRNKISANKDDLIVISIGTKYARNSSSIISKKYINNKSCEKMIKSTMLTTISVSSSNSKMS